ncbi:MAG: penicillin acylase family protein [Myxococcota bacterium]
MMRWLAALGAALLIGLGVLATWINQINDYQVDGTIRFPALDKPVTVTRDAYGVAHIAAENRRDMLRAQGFVTAQDRLFQMELYREITSGRLAQLVGEAGVASDTQMRVLGIPLNAKRMAAQLSPEARRFLSDYLDGVNAYIQTRTDEHPVELGVMGLSPKPWTVEDSVAILQFVSLQHSVNMTTEALAQVLLDTVGSERVGGLLPINVNPDRVPEALPVSPPVHLASLEKADTKDQEAFASHPVVPPWGSDRWAPLHFGSNNWVVGPERSASGKPMVVNDPHVDVRLLPGAWYPVSMSTPDFHAAGVALPIIPGVLVGRTHRVAYGVTNAYGDVMDLFLEVQDPSSPDHYLEGDERVAYERREEIIRIKDDEAEGGFREKKVVVRSTHRGPVISDHDLVKLGKRVVSLSWGAARAFGPEIGLDKLFFARSAEEVDAAIQQIDIHMFNFVFADVDGNFGRRASGKIPIRAVGEGALPVPVTGPGPYWVSWIPKDAMPGEINPETQ